MKYHPIRNQVLLEVEMQKPNGRILIPDANQKRSVILKVVAVGPAAPPELKPGRKALVQDYGGSVVKHDGKEFRLIHGDDILGVFE
jgi:co-chaperonin GroES (HSP10)